jgi:hypothetical protein
MDFAFCMVKTGFSLPLKLVFAPKRFHRSCFQQGSATEKNNISEEKTAVLSMKTAFSTLG